MSCRKDYIIAVYHDGIWNFLQLGGVISWVFSRKVKMYHTTKYGERMALRIWKKYNVDKVALFDVTGVERFSCSDVRNWSDRVVFEISKGEE